MKKLDLTGHQYGQLTVIKFARKINNLSYWTCECACGNKLEVTRNNLRTGDTKSCGCLRSAATAERHLTHGQSGTVVYNAWKCMRQRCLNKDHHKYHLWGGRGITICKAWNSFEIFAKDMGPHPGLGYSLERKNNEGNYEPDNCYWATAKEQANNTRNNKCIL